MFMAYLYSFVLGALILAWIWRKTARPCPFLFISLSLGLGLGCSSLLTFFSFLLFGQFIRGGIILIYILVVTALLFLNFSFYKNNGAKLLELFRNPSLRPLAFMINSFIFISFILSTQAILALARTHPYGEWDAWALWSMKTKFLILGKEHWKNIFTLHWHTQPDYPLLLPFMNAWVFAVSKAELFHITLINAVVMTFLTGMLLWAGLKQFMHPLIAWVGAFLLLSNNYYAFIGTAQYADIVLGYYLLASMILVTLSLERKDISYALVLGLFLGLMPFLKNEGILISILLFGIYCLYCQFSKSLTRELKQSFIKNTLAGLLITSPAAIIFKFSLAPPNRDILVTDLKNIFLYFDFNRLWTVIDSLTRSLIDPSWRLLWFFIILLFILGAKHYFYKEAGILTGFFLSYGFILAVIYLMNLHFDLSWRLIKTLPRILFYILPSILFLTFYTHDRKEMR